jgi:multisubunit Na+/H+ antiporter MnhE subunit
LAVIWLVLNGALTYVNVAWGIVVGGLSVWLSVRYMKPSPITGVRFIKLVFYPFFLLGQVYVSGFMVIRMIIRGCYTEVVTVETALNNDFLRSMLCNTITMIPGSVVLDRDNFNVTVMVLREKNAPPLSGDVAGEVMGAPEKKLLKAQL